MNPAFDRIHFALAQLCRALGLVATLQDGLLLYFQLRHRFTLLFGVRFPLGLDVFNPLFDLRDPKCDFFLFLFQFF